MINQDLIAKCYQAYNETARAAGLPEARALSPSRAKKMKERLTEARTNALDPDQTWREAMTALAQSSFCKGRNGRSWRADIDFVLQPLSFWRLVEGFYADKDATIPVRSPRGRGVENALQRGQKMNAIAQEYLRNFMIGFTQSELGQAASQGGWIDRVREYVWKEAVQQARDVMDERIVEISVMIPEMLIDGWRRS